MRKIQVINSSAYLNHQFDRAPWELHIFDTTYTKIPIKGEKTGFNPNPLCGLNPNDVFKKNKRKRGR